MSTVQSCPIPENSLLDKLSASGAYVDCFVTEINRVISLADFVYAFYTTPLFKIERFILGVMVSKPSNNQDAKNLAEGNSTHFAMWTLNGRTENEILLKDILWRTCSWFMVESNTAKTKIYFGSAVLPKTGNASLSFMFRALLGFHKIYSFLLLSFAKARLESSGINPLKL